MLRGEPIQVPSWFWVSFQSEFQCVHTILTRYKTRDTRYETREARASL